MTRLARLPLLATLISSAALAAPSPEQAELAERLLQTCQRMVASPTGAPVAGVLADVAERLFENDTRLLRTAIDLRLALGHREKAVALLTAYRRLDPGDQLAQVQSIDLQQRGLESVDARADYLARVAASERVPSEVRSHAAVLRAGVELERGRDKDAAAAVAQALGLNPLNPRALRMRADAVAESGTAGERAEALINLLRADPLQFATASRLGEELLRAGLTDSAAEWYRKFFDALTASGYGPGTDDSLNAAHALVLAGREREAKDIANAALRDDAGDIRLHTLGLLLDQAAKDEAGFKSALAEARTQALRNLMGLHGKIDPKAPPMDTATVVTLPDVKADAAAVKAGTDPKLADAYVQALGDLAWLDVYFGGRAPDVTVTEAIHTLAGADSALAHRLAGFAALAADRVDEADVAFAPVAAQDPLSRLGLLAMRLKKGQDKAAIMTEAGKLLEELPTDVWPLTIRQTLREAGTLKFRAAGADAVAAAYAKVPKDLLSFAADGRAFYLIDVDPLGGGVEIGQPILMRVTLQNLSDRPLVVGPGGAVSQQVSLDATVRGVSEQAFPAAAIAKLTGLLVVPPRRSVSTVVRLDSSELGHFLASVPQAGASVFVSAVSNPVAKENVILPGAGGFRTQARGVIDRPQIPFTRPEVRDALAKQLQDPSALRRLRAVSAVGACATWLSAAQNEEAKPLIAQATDMLTRAADQDASSTVRAAARQELLSLAPEAEEAAKLAAMIGSPDLESRVLGCLLSVSRPKAERATVLKALSTDADESVRKLALAVIELPDAPAATQP